MFVGKGTVPSFMLTTALTGIFEMEEDMGIAADGVPVLILFPPADEMVMVTDEVCEGDGDDDGSGNVV